MLKYEYLEGKMVYLFTPYKLPVKDSSSINEHKLNHKIKPYFNFIMWI